MKKAAPARKTAEQAATMAAAVKKAPATATLKGMFEHLAERLELPKKRAHALLDGMVEALTGHLKNGERIRMSGLGIPEVKNRPARQGRNPATGETIQIAGDR